jgi:hypothetical protein
MPQREFANQKALVALNFSPLVECRGHDHNTHHGKGLRTMPTIRLIVYDPPEDGYPFLAVAHNAALATEAARAKPSDDQDA